MAAKSNFRTRSIFGFFLLNRDQAVQAKQTLESIYGVNVLEVLAENCFGEQFIEKPDFRIHKVNLSTGESNYVCASGVNLHLVLSIGSHAEELRNQTFLKKWEEHNGKALTPDSRLVLSSDSLCDILDPMNYVDAARDQVIDASLRSYADKEWSSYEQDMMRFLKVSDQIAEMV